MKKMTSIELRKTWLNFWESKKHLIIPSKSLIPKEDPSLLWINSGVATLKDYFSGKKIPPQRRLANSQKCIRTNDIDNVGITARHHTLFEMLGNFSIGDYFKKEAIQWGYEFIFNILEMEKDKIYITYYSEDQDTYKEWINLGISKENLIKGNRETNFWDLGEGPCGPDTEIFYDRGVKYDPSNIGLKLLRDDIENDRYVEIWNIVFSQLNNDGEGGYTELENKNIDTGAGLERIVSVMQNTPTNFETDLFMPIIREIEKISCKKYVADNYFEKDKTQFEINRHMKVIADHTRAAILAIQDGAKPSNTQRGYIIRRLIRRAYRSGRQLQITEKSFLHQLVDVVKKTLPIYKIDKEIVEPIIKKEEESFSKTIKQGEELLIKMLKGKNEIPVDIAFKLFETYGFPIELTKEYADEHNVKLNLEDVEKYKDMHAKKSRGSKVTKAMQKQINVVNKIKGKISDFIGYEKTSSSDSKIIIQEKEGSKIYLLLDKTPFYATSGGQQYDHGMINDAKVLDVFKDSHGNHWHIIDRNISGNVLAQVDDAVRIKKARNHTGTHMLGFALRSVLGEGVIQLGSENDARRLRFDFPYSHKPTKKEMRDVEAKVNELISMHIKREYIIDTWENGISLGAIVLENEDNDPNALSRIVKFGSSIEFCGGTHVENTADLQKFKIIKVESKGSGTYRIDALTSNDTIEKYEKAETNILEQQLIKLINRNMQIDSSYNLKYKKNIDDIKNAISAARESYKEIIKKFKSTDDNIQVSESAYKGNKAFIKLDVDRNSVKKIALSLRSKYPDSIIIIGSTNGDRSTLAVASIKFDAKNIFDEISSKNNGRGGGNDSFAMGSMNKISKI